MDIILDFDGTVVINEFHRVGEDIGAVPVLKDLVAYGHIMIDDKAVGCPLVYGKHKSPYVDWIKIRTILDEMGYFSIIR